MNKSEVAEVLRAVGVPAAVFARQVGISYGALYKWLRDELNLSADTTARIIERIEKLKLAID